MPDSPDDKKPYSFDSYLERLTQESLYNLAFFQGFPVDPLLNDSVVQGTIPSGPIGTPNVGTDVGVPESANKTYSSSSQGSSRSEKIQIAQWMASEAKKNNLPPELPVMVSLQESGLRNITYGDRDSVGFFQQRPSTGWGSQQQILVASYALKRFLTAASNKRTFTKYHNGTTGFVKLPSPIETLVKGSTSVDDKAKYLSIWGQIVQASKYPFAYAKHYQDAINLINGK